MFVNIKEKFKIKHFIFTIISLLAFPGFILFMLPSPLNASVLDESFIENVNVNTLPKTLNNITIKNGRIYNIDMSITDISGTVITAAKIERKDGTTVWDAGAGAHYSSKNSIFLNAGEYSVTFAFDSQEKHYTSVDIQFKIR